MSNKRATELGLRAAIAAARSMYILPKHPLADEALIPALGASTSLDIMMGYFSSKSLAEIAPGLATFLQKSAAPMRMVISPFLTDTDFDVLTQDEEKLRGLAEELFLEEPPKEDQLVRHTLECLAWLIAHHRLEIQVAIMRRGQFHQKVWLFSDGQNHAAVHGSPNLTERGLSQNREQLAVSGDWMGDAMSYQVECLMEEFALLWSGGDDDCCVIQLSDAVAHQVVQRYKPEVAPTEDVVRRLWQNTRHGTTATIDDTAYVAKMTIPGSLIYDRGEFAHQGQAANSWLEAGCRGILAMATGSGKTAASLICATRLQDNVRRVLVVVSAPYRPLIVQWCGEVEAFGVNAIDLAAVGGPEQRNREIRQAGRRLRNGVSRAEIVVVSNAALSNNAFQTSVARIDVPKLLIADECHNLGSDSFISDPPLTFDYRLGLSATPVRQYDAEGSKALIRYFGDVCFSFPLERAIGTCLVEYDYHVHFVKLTTFEMDRWHELTELIAKYRWQLETDGAHSYVDNLLRQRRLVVETAEQKVNALERLLDKHGARTLRYTLIYATDKQPAQLEKVNKGLRQRRVLFHQLTAEETRDRAKTARILSAYQNGQLQVLTAKRVLDEGVNIPQIKTAFILASTTVQRQWIQRRGRLLRRCEAIGKSHAVIHDFVVLTPGLAEGIRELDGDARQLIRSELDRVWEFAQLSRNGAQDGGPYEAVKRLEELADERVMS